MPASTRPCARRYSSTWSTPSARTASSPASCGRLRTMLVADESRLLNHLAEDYYSGSGVIVDGGAFLGGSTVALADGLRRNPRRRRLGAEKPIHSFDRFEVEEYARVFYPDGVAPGTSFPD